MNFEGIVVGLATFLIIGIFHPIVTAFSCFWSILELIQQERRVQKGWFPANPKRKKN